MSRREFCKLLSREVNLSKEKERYVHPDERLIYSWEAGHVQRPHVVYRRALERLGAPLPTEDRRDQEISESGERVDFALSRRGQVDLKTATHLRDAVRMLDERYVYEASTALLADVGQHLGQIRYLTGSAPSNRVSKELYAAQSEASTLMGQLVWDASQRRDHYNANRHFDQAVDAAREYESVSAEGLALLRKTIVLLYGEQDPVSALEMASRAAQATRRESTVLTGLALLHSAEAYAMLGVTTACEKRLSEAGIQLERISAQDPAANLFSPSQYGRIAGSCYLSLQNYEKARSFLESTADTLSDQSKSHGIILGNLTLVAIREGDLDETVKWFHRAVDVVATNRGGGGLNIIFGASRELRKWKSEALVQEMQDRLLGLLTAATE